MHFPFISILVRLQHHLNVKIESKCNDEETCIIEINIFISVQRTLSSLTASDKKIISRCILVEKIFPTSGWNLCLVLYNFVW